MAFMAVILASSQNFFSSLVQKRGKSLVSMMTSSSVDCSNLCLATSCGFSGGVAAGNVGAMATQTGIDTADEWTVETSEVAQCDIVLSATVPFITMSTGFLSGCK